MSEGAYIFLIPIVILIFYITIINEGRYKINKINTRILEQKNEVQRINIICESLFLTNINYHNFIINYYYIYCLIVILLKYIIILNIILYLHFNNNTKYTIILIISFAIISFIIATIIYNYLIKDINENIKKFDNIENELNNKKNEINNFNKNKILLIIDNNNDISFIDNNLDLYISNFEYINVYISHIRIDMWEYSYSYNLNIKKNKTTVILELKDELIKNKKNEVTPESLEDYKKSLELKINLLIGLIQISEFN